MNHRSNNLDFIRLTAAAFVIYGHHFLLFGKPTLVPVVMGKGMHTFGVDIFFAISGFLVSSSWRIDPSPFRFFAKRVLRIFPGLIGVCVFAALILGPAVTTLTLPDYFTNRSTWIYLWQNVQLKIDYSLPGVFLTNPVAGAVNGSLWSLPAEFAMYIVVAIVGLICAALPRKFTPLLLWAILLAIGTCTKFYLNKLYAGPPLIIWATLVSATFDAGVYFFAGAFIAQLPFHSPFRTVLAFPPSLLLATLPSAISIWADPLLLAYVVLTVGMWRTPVIQDEGKFGDFSYGVYLYAFPVQQTIWLLMKREYGMALPLVATCVVTLALAVISWRLIEEPSLRWKPGTRAPGPLAGVEPRLTGC